MKRLPAKVVGEQILARIPITSVREVRSTCKLWDSLSREWVLGEAAAATTRHEFVGFMTMDSKVCSMRFHVRKEQEDFAIKQVDLLSHVEISQVFHCDGLLLCVAKDKSRLLLWNPYLGGQARSIGPRSSFRRTDRFALGYDRKNHRTHKILRCGDRLPGGQHQNSDFEIYDLSSNSNSWRVLDITSELAIEPHERGASLKGDTYFFAREKVVCDGGGEIPTAHIKNFLLCFDFTTERFGPPLPLPFHSYDQETVALSCVGEKQQQLAVLYQQGEYPLFPLEIWVTSMIEPEAVSWIKFLKLDKSPVVHCLGHFPFRWGAGSFFIDEEEKAVVVFDVDTWHGLAPTREAMTTEPPHHTAFINGTDDGYFRYMSLGEAPDLSPKPACVGHYIYPTYRPPLVCSSSYLPSLVRINH